MLLAYKIILINQSVNIIRISTCNAIMQLGCYTLIIAELIFVLGNELIIVVFVL